MKYFVSNKIGHSNVVEGLSCLVASALFFGYLFCLRVSLSSMLDQILGKLNITIPYFGLLSASFFISYASLQIPAGYAIDKFGYRKSLIVGAFLCCIGCTLFCCATNFYTAFVGRLLIGAGGSIGFLSNLKIIYSYWRSDTRNTLTGVVLLFGSFGSIAGGYPLINFSKMFGLHGALLLLIFAGILIFISILLFVKQSNSDQSCSQDFLRGISMVIKMPANWVLGIYGLLVYVPISSFCDLWAIKFLMDIHNFSCLDASVCAGLVYFSFALGTAILPKIFSSYGLTLHLVPLLSGSILFMILYQANTIYHFYALFSLLGFVASGQTICHVIIYNINQYGLNATSSGFHNMLCLLSGVIFQPVTSLLLNLTHMNYAKTFLIFPSCCLAAFLLIYIFFNRLVNPFIVK